MNIKNGLICLLIVAILTLSVPNVAAASTNKQTTEVRGGYTLDVPVKDQPVLVLLLSNNVTDVDKSVDLFGGLATDESGTLHQIEDATINIQHLNYDGTAWDTIGTLTTQSGNYSGFFIVRITPKDPGAYVYRATYDGDSQYEPAISNWVALRAYS